MVTPAEQVLFTALDLDTQIDTIRRQLDQNLPLGEQAAILNQVQDIQRTFENLLAQAGNVDEVTRTVLDNLAPRIQNLARDQKNIALALLQIQQMSAEEDSTQAIDNLTQRVNACVTGLLERNFRHPENDLEALRGLRGEIEQISLYSPDLKKPMRAQINYLLDQVETGYVNFFTQQITDAQHSPYATLDALQALIRFKTTTTITHNQPRKALDELVAQTGRGIQNHLLQNLHQIQANPNEYTFNSFMQLLREMSECAQNNTNLVDVNNQPLIEHPINECKKAIAKFIEEERPRHAAGEAENNRITQLREEFENGKAEFLDGAFEANKLAGNPGSINHYFVTHPGAKEEIFAEVNQLLERKLGPAAIARIPFLQWAGREILIDAVHNYFRKKEQNLHQIPYNFFAFTPDQMQAEFNRLLQELENPQADEDRELENDLEQLDINIDSPINGDNADEEYAKILNTLYTLEDLRAIVQNPFPNLDELVRSFDSLSGWARAGIAYMAGKFLTKNSQEVLTDEQIREKGREYFLHMQPSEERQIILDGLSLIVPFEIIDWNCQHRDLDELKKNVLELSQDTRNSIYGFVYEIAKDKGEITREHHDFGRVAFLGEEGFSVSWETRTDALEQASKKLLNNWQAKHNILN